MSSGAAPPPPIVMGPFVHALAGGIGGAIALALTYPLDIVKTRLQVVTISDFLFLFLALFSFSLFSLSHLRVCFL